MPEEQTNGNGIRGWLALAVVAFGLSGMVGLGITVIICSNKQNEAATLASSGLLPLWGAWAGTVLAEDLWWKRRESIPRRPKTLTG